MGLQGMALRQAPNLYAFVRDGTACARPFWQRSHPWSLVPLTRTAHAKCAFGIREGTLGNPTINGSLNHLIGEPRETHLPRLPE